MRAWTAAELEAYLDSGAWVGKSGAYGLQLPHDPFVTNISGSASNVVGVPLECRAEIYQFNPDASDAPRKIEGFDMYGAWSFGAYSLSYDRKTLFTERFHGVSLKKGEKGDGESIEYDVPHMTSRYVLWSPDSQKCVMSMSNGTVLIDVANLAPKGGILDPPTAGLSMLYKAPKDTVAYGGCWAPNGTGYFILEEDATHKIPGSRLKRFPSGGGGAGETVIDHPHRIGYFMTPNSWFTDGSGPKLDRPYQILFGASDGFFISDSTGKTQEKLEGIPADGLDDIEWSPGPEDMFATVSRHLSTDVKKQTFRGVNLVRPAKLGSGKPPAIEQLVDSMDVHTLLFSPKGKYVTFANKTWVKYREPGKKDIVTVTMIAGGAPLAVNGFAWDLKEERLVITAGNGIYLHDPKTNTTKLVTSVGDPKKTFTAEPDWRGNEVIFTAYNDIGEPMHR